MNKGNYWEVGETSFVEPEAQTQAATPQDDHDEIEYMPPNTAGARFLCSPGIIKRVELNRFIRFTLSTSV